MVANFISVCCFEWRLIYAVYALKTCQFSLVSIYLVVDLFPPHTIHTIPPNPPLLFCGQNLENNFVVSAERKTERRYKIVWGFWEQRKQKKTKDKKRKQQTNSKMITNIRKMKFPLFSI